ncbi:MAG: molybdenum cofactor synthesis domain-containing protein [Kiritimatiellia bacterium]
MNAHVISVNRSEAKGMAKTPAPCIVLTATGVQGDAHAGAWHRQVSLLSVEGTARFTTRTGRAVQPGDFAENITTQGVPLEDVRIPDQLRVGDCELEVTQIGKACHGEGCAIFRDVGQCLMPTEGIFCKVTTPGTLRPGDPIVWTRGELRCQVLTLSDRASQGIYADLSGPAVADALTRHFATSHWRAGIQTELLPDDPARLRASVTTAAQSGSAILVTTGGTGIGPRDITPDVVRPMLDREIPGIMEQIRVTCGMQHPAALLSRSLAGMIGSMLVFCIPGSRRAATEYMTEIVKNLDHALRMIRGMDQH